MERGGYNLFGFCYNNALLNIDEDGRIMLTPNDPEFLYEKLASAYNALEAAYHEGDPKDITAALIAYNWSKIQLNNAVKTTFERVGGQFGARWGLGATSEGGFMTAELGLTVGGVAIATGAYLVVSYVVDQTSQHLGAMINAQVAANNAIIDSWSDPDMYDR
jgi:hypothetical protein